MIELSPKQKKVQQQITSLWKFMSFLISQLPMGLIAGIRVRELSSEKCVTSVPMKWVNKNPFKSMYFAVQSMAAELSTAVTCLLATSGQNPSIAFIITDLKVEFVKKATSRVYFTCENASLAFEAVDKCKQSGQAEQCTFQTIGRMSDGTIVSEFALTWSFKQRTS